MEYVELIVKVRHATDKAVLVRLEDDEEVWIPLSQVEDNGEDFKRDYEGPMYVTEWFVEKEGLA